MITANGRRYAIPRRKTVVICVDGCDPAYISNGLASGIIPRIHRMMEQGFACLADAAMPTFTNPNNASIVTGVPPAIHGVAGNYYLNRETGEEVMVTDAHLMRCPTILSELSRAGVRIAAITAKDKLRKLIGHQTVNGICFSSELAGEATLRENGIEGVEHLVGRPAPDKYSSDLSLYVLDAGIRLLELDRADLFYLSLSDLVQHACAPGETEADVFYGELDKRIGRLIDLDATVALTADHGMNDKTWSDGSPRVVYLEEAINEQAGAGSVKVICPIADPFVKHHGALGSFVRCYIRNPTLSLSSAMDIASRLPGIAQVMDGPAAASRYQLPLDREADFIAIGDTHTAIGATREQHDISALAGHHLRSHGGLSEQEVPFILSHPLNEQYAKLAGRHRPRNFDIFDFALNGTDSCGNLNPAKSGG